jgi:hypothetical protein
MPLKDEQNVTIKFLGHIKPNTPTGRSRYKWKIGDN